MLIKNIIFDIGNVMVRWDPQAIIATAFPEHPEQEYLARNIFNQTWLDLNLGLIDETQAHLHYANTLSMDISHFQHLAKLINESLILLPGSEKLFHDLHEAGFQLYALTDNTHAIMRYLQKKYDFWSYFLGVVVSAEVGYLKPHAPIFQYLLEKYQLQPQECLFIDDMARNVEGAKALGLAAIQFIDVVQCRQALRQYQILS